MSSPVFSTRAARRLDEDLLAAVRLIGTTGLGCTGLHPERSGRLRIGLAQDGNETALVLEDANDEAPRGPALGFGRRRLVVLSPDMYAKDAEALLRRVRDALDMAAQGPLTLWMTPPEQGSDRIGRSGGGLAASLMGRVALGTPVWDGWKPERFTWLVDEAGSGIEMIFSAVGQESVTYLLVDGQDREGWFQVAGTTLGPLMRRGDSDQPDAAHPLDDPLGFIFSQAFPLGAHWTEAGSQADDAAEVMRRRQQNTGLIGDCNRGGTETMGERRSRFFDVWGTADALGNSAGVAVRSDRVLLMHASRECALATNTLSGDLAVGMRPWGEERVDFSLSPGNYLVTDVDDKTIVMGGEERYLEALEDSLQRQPDGEVVVFQGCDYHMIGDDVRGACRRCAAEGKDRVRFMQPEIPQFQEMDSRSWWGNFLEACAATGAERSAAPQVNLVGYGPPGGRGVREASTLLEAAGITVGATALPFPSGDAEERWGEAWLTLVSPWLPVDEVFTHHLRKQGLPYAAPPLPYGIRGSRDWLGSVAAALGIAPITTDAFGELVGEQVPRLPGLEAEARSSGGRIGLVFDKGTLEEILAPEFFFGTSPLDVLADLGFEVIFVHAPIAGPARVPGDASLSVLATRGATFEAWEPGTGNETVLEHYDFDLVYCDALETGFIREAGSATFDIRDLGMGLGGMERSIEYFLAGRRLTLYRRLRHLGSTP